MTAARSSTKESRKDKEARHPFRAAVLRGLGVVLPPLLTIVIFLWIGATVGQYAIEPLISTTETAIVWCIADVKTEAEIPPIDQGKPEIEIDGKKYTRMADSTYIPTTILRDVRKTKGRQPVPETGYEVYYRYVGIKYLRPWIVVPFFLIVFVLFLYLLGKFIAAGAGRMFWGLFERGVLQVPLVRNVYGAVKQISDFVLSQQEIEFSRVVAVEWPRKGVWAIAFVTGESIPDIEAAANEPVLSVLVPTSPMPVTGFTVTVKKSETIDLNISFDQAVQFIVSCGVAAPVSKTQFLTTEQPIALPASPDQQQESQQPESTENVG